MYILMYISTHVYMYMSMQFVPSCLRSQNSTFRNLLVVWPLLPPEISTRTKRIEEGHEDSPFAIISASNNRNTFLLLFC